MREPDLLDEIGFFTSLHLFQFRISTFLTQVAPVLVENAVEHDDRSFVLVKKGACQLVAKPARHSTSPRLLGVYR